MAERKRRGENVSDDRLDDDFDDVAEVDDEFDSDLDEDLDDDFDVDEEDEEPVRARSSGRDARASLIKTRDKADSRPRTAARGRPAKPGDRRPSRTKAGGRPNILARLVNFVREVVAELRKVIWPTRKELLTYTAVVVVFVTAMLAIVGGLDWGFTQLAVWVFGNGTAAE